MHALGEQREMTKVIARDAPHQGASVLDLQGSRRRLARGADDEMPQSQLTLGNFQSTKYLITVEEYAAFLQGTSYIAPANWTSQMQKSDRPVDRVSWDDARTYAQWLSLQASGTGMSGGKCGASLGSQRCSFDFTSSACILPEDMHPHFLKNDRLQCLHSKRIRGFSGPLFKPKRRSGWR
jgi:hypothetical protein